MARFSAHRAEHQGLKVSPSEYQGRVSLALEHQGALSLALEYQGPVSLRWNTRGAFARVGIPGAHWFALEHQGRSLFAYGIIGARRADRFATFTGP